MDAGSRMYGLADVRVALNTSGTHTVQSSW